MSKNKNSFNIKVREREQSQRQLKVSRIIHESLISCFRSGGGLPLQLSTCPLTITKVTISPDLRIVYCFFLTFNTSLSSDELLVLLEEAKYTIRDYVTRNVKLRYSPEIRFCHDFFLEE